MLIEKNEYVEPTNEERLLTIKNIIKNTSRSLNDLIIRKHALMFNIVWNNQDGFTPQEILTEMGADAVELFTYSSSIQLLLASADPDYIILETPNEYVLNEDGTVTVGELR